MPELPEVETMRRGIVSIVGSSIESASCPPCTRRPILLSPAIKQFDRRLRGKRITAIGRQGKRVIIEIEDDQSIVIEPRMTGLVLLTDPPTEEHLRLRLKLRGGPSEQLLVWDRRGLGTIRLLTADEVKTKVEAILGVDALAISPQQLREALCHSAREIKVSLLDQSAVAGVGNLYAAEILFLAQIDPRARCNRLTRAQWERIVSEMHRVLQEAIRYEGSTLSDGTYRNAINGEGGYQAHHFVYDREGKPCLKCENGTIKRIVQAQRSTFFCPVCQRKTDYRQKRSPS